MTVHQTGLRQGAVVDQLDYVNFPLRSYRVEAETVIGKRAASGRQGCDSFTRFEIEGTSAAIWGRSTFNAQVRAKSAGGEDLSGLGRYSYNLGGFHRLSGYRYNHLAGSHVLFGRLTMYQRLEEAPFFARDSFVGADTGMGPLYLGVTYAPRGESGLYLFLGRP